MVSENRCGYCGSAITVLSSDEGTHTVVALAENVASAAQALYDTPLGTDASERWRVLGMLLARWKEARDACA